MSGPSWLASMQLATCSRDGLTLAEAPPASVDGVAWINLKLEALNTAERLQPVRSLHQQICHLCPELEVHMLDELLEADLWPRVKAYGLGGEIRGVSAVGMWPVDADAAADETGASRRGLGFQLIEVLASEGWVISGWHQPRTYRGSGEGIPGNGELSQTDLYRIADEACRAGRVVTSGDLGLLILQEAAATYTGAIRSLYDWLEDWEFDFYERSRGDGRAEIDRQPLIDLRALVYHCRKCVSGINAPQAKVQTFWFNDVTSLEAAERLDETIDRTLRRLTELSDRMRSAFDVAQLQIAERQARRTERLQQNLDLIAAVLLVPTLIAGAYGANTDFPGRDSRSGTAVMILLMIAGGAFTYALLRLRRRS